MRTTVSHISAYLENWAPKSTKLDYDNVGLLVGDHSQPVSKIITCLDCTMPVVDEAITQNAELIVAHHPLIFKKRSSVTTADEQGRIITRLIQNNISLIAAHTNLDASSDGVSVLLAEKLGLTNISILKHSPHSVLLNCNTGLNESQLAAITDENLLSLNNGRAELFVSDYHLHRVMAEIKDADATAKNFNWHKVNNSPENQGFGAIGELQNPHDEQEFLNHVAGVLNCRNLRYSGTARQIKKVAVCGGSGSQLTSDAIRAGADAFVTADIKYHDYFTDTPNFLLIDTGHYENEIHIAAEMQRRLNDAFDDVEVAETTINTNPLKNFVKN